MAADQQRLSTTDRENLVAYLDGELDEAGKQQISTKLSNSVSARREVELLKQTWDMLDFLPRPRASEDFASRTLTLATGQVTLDDRLATAASRTAGQLMRALAVAACAGATFLGAHALVRWAWPDPTARLARDLSIAENLDAYRAVESFELLKQLDEAVPEFQATRTSP